MGMDQSEFIGCDWLDFTTTASVAAAATSNLEVKPPIGYAYKIKRITFTIPGPVGAGAGTHGLRMMNDTSQVTPSGIFDCVATFPNTILTNTGALVGNSSELPTNAREQYLLLVGGLEIWATNDNPITFIYSNDTDVAQTGSRYLKVQYEVWKNAV